MFFGRHATILIFGENTLSEEVFVNQVYLETFVIMKVEDQRFLSIIFRRTGRSNRMGVQIDATFMLLRSGSHREPLFQLQWKAGGHQLYFESRFCDALVDDPCFIAKSPC